MSLAEKDRIKKSREGSLLLPVPEGKVVSHSLSSASGSLNFNQNLDSDKSPDEGELRKQKLLNIRNKIQNGFYQDNEVDEDISDKLSRVFDRLL